LRLVFVHMNGPTYKNTIKAFWVGWYVWKMVICILCLSKTCNLSCLPLSGSINNWNFIVVFYVLLVRLF
jgi:hypothetical protein